MEQDASEVTVFFEEPFWVCVYQRTTAGKLEVCKITFGAQPKDGEVYEFLLKNWAALRFSPPVEAEKAGPQTVNSKRMQKQVRRSLENTGIGTKAQQALSLLREQNKREKQQTGRALRQAALERRFALRQQKRKEKHRGH